MGAETETDFGVSDTIREQIKEESNEEKIERLGNEIMQLQADLKDLKQQLLVRHIIHEDESKEQ